jgi:protein-tyrosine phosphatase
MLSKLGITHVVNCAADYSENYLQAKGVQYKSYHLKDHVREDISCVFYDAIDFIANARKQGGKLYVHCVQGISRSATIILAYNIFTEKITYQEAYAYLKEKRACINPNMTFIA